MNLLAAAKLYSQKECYYKKCHAKFPNGLIELSGRWDDGTLKYDPAQLLFHLQDTHGMPSEIMLEELDKVLNSDMGEHEISTYNSLFKGVS